MESGNGSVTDKPAVPTTTLDQEDEHLSDARKSSASLSSSSSSGEDFGLEANEIKHDQDIELASHGSADDLTQSPPRQVMEKQHPGSPTSPSAYRIPSSVFARSKSTAPMEWSVASNESLFSIQMGNMSFTREHLNLMGGRSGELAYMEGKSGELGGRLSTVNPLFDLSSNQPPSRIQSTPPPPSPPGKTSASSSSSENQSEISQKSAAAFNESKAAETMREVIRESEDSNSKEKPNIAGLHSSSTRRSDASAASTKSFAFPILTGGYDKNGSISQNPSSRGNAQPATPKVAMQQSTKEAQSPSRQQSQTPKAESTPAPKSNSSLLSSKWFSCFPCCSSCS